MLDRHTETLMLQGRQNGARVLIAGAGLGFYLRQGRRDPRRLGWSCEVPCRSHHHGMTMLFWIIMSATVLVTTVAAVVLGISLAETGRLHFVAFVVLWVVTGVFIPMWLIIRQGRK